MNNNTAILPQPYIILPTNSLAPSIKFTHEIKQYNTLPILDVQRKVDRKPTNILSDVHYFSNHQINVKKSVFYFNVFEGL